MRRAHQLARHLGVSASQSQHLEDPDSDEDMEPAGGASLAPASGAYSASSRKLFANAELQPPDPIFGLTVAFKADKDANKLNLGVGAYRTEEGKPWILGCVQKAEEFIMSEQAKGTINKEYLPIDGHPELRKLSAQLIFGSELMQEMGARCQNIQTVSGTGSLRLSFEYVARFMAKQGGQPPVVLTPDPTWANHKKIIAHAGCTERAYRYLNRKNNTLDIEGMLEDLDAAAEGSVVLLHACAHNPTGVDPTQAQWDDIAKVCWRKGHLVIFDSAYQGFATGDLEADAWPVRRFVKSGVPLFVAQSYSKNFGLYAERCGCLQIVTETEAEAKAVQSMIKGVARGMYSNPPIHGALIVATVLGDATLTKLWHEELLLMANRIRDMRQLLFDALIANKTPGNWDHIISQIGMFSYTGLSQAQVKYIIDKHHIYFTSDGRISMAGLSRGTVGLLADGMKAAVENA